MYMTPKVASGSSYVPPYGSLSNQVAKLISYFLKIGKLTFLLNSSFEVNSKTWRENSSLEFYFAGDILVFHHEHVVWHVYSVFHIISLVLVLQSSEIIHSADFDALYKRLLRGGPLQSIEDSNQEDRLKHMVRIAIKVIELTSPFVGIYLCDGQDTHKAECACVDSNSFTSDNALQVKKSQSMLTVGGDSVLWALLNMANLREDNDISRLQDGHQDLFFFSGGTIGQDRKLKGIAKLLRDSKTCTVTIYTRANFRWWFF